MINDFTHMKAKVNEIWPNFPEEEFVKYIQMIESPFDESYLKSSIKLIKPYGINTILCKGDVYGYSFVQMNVNQSTSLHFHEVRKEFFYVRNGCLKLRKGNDIYILNKDQFGFSTPNEMHSLSNNGDETLEIIEIFSPVLLDDKVRVDDIYNRQLGNVTHKQ